MKILDRSPLSIAYITLAKSNFFEDTSMNNKYCSLYLIIASFNKLSTNSHIVTSFAHLSVGCVLNFVILEMMRWVFARCSGKILWNMSQTGRGASNLSVKGDQPFVILAFHNKSRTPKSVSTGFATFSLVHLFTVRGRQKGEGYFS